MNKFILLVALLIPSLSFAQIPAEQNKVIDYLNSISVTVKAGNSQGSGTIFVRDDRCFVLTAAHVVESIRKTRKTIVGGDEKTVVEFSPVTVLSVRTHNGKYVGKSEYTGKIIKYSDKDHGEDLAVIELDLPNAFSVYTVLYSGDLLPLGTDVHHVGSFQGEFGANSYSKGYISQYGRVIANKNFFQTTATAFGGSSGGGVMTFNGQLYGVLVRGAGETMNFCVGYERVADWLRRANLEWVVNHSLEVGTIGDIEVE